MLKINIFDLNSRWIVFVIVLGLFISGIESQPYEIETTKENEASWTYFLKKVDGDLSPTVNLINELQAKPLLSVKGMDKEMLTLFFLKERKILNNVKKYLYRVREQLPLISNSTEPGMLENEEGTLIFVYITFLSFWISVNFKICSLIMSYNDVWSDENVKLMCDSHFNGMAFAFSEFKEKLGSLRIASKNKNLTYAAIKVLQLDLDFIMNENDLKEKEPANYNQTCSIIKWDLIPEIEINGKIFKTNFPSTDIDRQFNIESGIPKHLIFSQLSERLKSQINKFVIGDLYEKFTRWIFGDRLLSSTIWSTSWNLSNYFTSKQMWQHVAKTEFKIPTDIEPLDRIQKAIELICEVRNVDYTLLYNGLQSSSYDESQ